MAVSDPELRPAVFLDKDGTLVEDVPYNVEPARIRLQPGAGAALRRLQDAGYLLVVVTNQSGVARGLFGEEALAGVKKRLDRLLLPFGVTLSGFYYCPHHPEGSVAEYAVECDCRKPMPGLIERAARRHRVDTDHSWMVGDILNDVEAGNRAGCRSILLDNGGETEWRSGELRSPLATASDLEEVATIILSSNVAWRERACNATYSS